MACIISRGHRQKKALTVYNKFFIKHKIINIILTQYVKVRYNEAWSIIVILNNILIIIS